MTQVNERNGWRAGRAVMRVELEAVRALTRSHPHVIPDAAHKNLEGEPESPGAGYVHQGGVTFPAAEGVELQRAKALDRRLTVAPHLA